MTFLDGLDCVFDHRFKKINRAFLMDSKIEICQSSNRDYGLIHMIKDLN